MKFIPFNKELYTRNTCPFCKANEVVRFTGWVIDEVRVPRKLKKQLKNENKWPLWIAYCVEVECTKEPDFDKPGWDRWNEIHDTQYPYIDWHPHVMAIEKSVNKRYRFYDNNSNRL